MKKRMALRTRITVLMGLMFLFMSLLLAFLLLFNAQRSIIVPFAQTAEVQLDEAGNPVISRFYVSENQMIVTAVNQYYEISMWAIVGCCVIGIVAVYVTTGISLRPVKKLKDEITSIDGKDLSVRIQPEHTGDELMELADAFNQMLERVERAFERERSFSSGAAHELKTPLAVIKSNLDVLKLSETPSAQEYSEVIRVVDRQTERMTRLIQDLFTMCSLHGYALDDRIDVEQMIREVLQEKHADVAGKHLCIQLDMTPAHVMGNEVMLKHAVSNLIDNAIKYNCKNGAIHISVSTCAEHCAIEIADTGIGIGEEAQLHMYEPFYREDKSRSRKVGGAGLGLSIVKSIVDQHKGEVQFRPNVPSGAVFTLILRKENAQSS